MTITSTKYESWLNQVGEALSSINMPMDDWQKVWPFDFRKEFDLGTSAEEAASKANRFWWRAQNKSIHQDCLKSPNCWLPRDHQGECQPLA